MAADDEFSEGDDNLSDGLNLDGDEQDDVPEQDEDTEHGGYEDEVYFSDKSTALVTDSEELESLEDRVVFEQTQNNSSHEVNDKEVLQSGNEEDSRK